MKTCPCCRFDLTMDGAIGRHDFYMKPDKDPVINGRIVHFSPKDRRVLMALMKNGMTTHLHVLRELKVKQDATISLSIHRIRKTLKRIGLDPIKTVYGHGWRWEWPSTLAKVA